MHCVFSKWENTTNRELWVRRTELAIGLATLKAPYVDLIKVYCYSSMKWSNCETSVEL